MDAVKGKNECSEYVYRGREGASRCTRTGKVSRDGKWYCDQHDPVVVAAKIKKRDADDAAKWAEQEKTWRAQEVADTWAKTCTDACATSGITDPLRQIPLMVKVLEHCRYSDPIAGALMMELTTPKDHP